MPSVGSRLLDRQRLLPAQQTLSHLRLIRVETSATLASQTTQDYLLGVPHPSLLCPFPRPAFLPPQMQESAWPPLLKNAGPPKRREFRTRGEAGSSFVFLEGSSRVEGWELAEGTWQRPARPSGGNRRDYHTGCWARGFWEGWGAQGAGPHRRRGQSHLGAHSGLPELRKDWSHPGGGPCRGSRSQVPTGLPPQLRVGRTVWAGASPTGRGDARTPVWEPIPGSVTPGAPCAHTTM